MLCQIRVVFELIFHRDINKNSYIGAILTAKQVSQLHGQHLLYSTKLQLYVHEDFKCLK